LAVPDAPTEFQMKPPGPDRGAALAPAVFLVLFLLSIASMLLLFRAFLTDLILAILLVALAYPRYQRVLAWTGGRAWLASALMTGLIVVAIGIPASFLIISLSREAAMAYDLTRDSLSVDGVRALLFGESWVADEIRRWSERLGVQLTAERIRAWIAGAAGGIATFAYTHINSFLANVLSTALHFLITMLAVFYLFMDGLRLKQWAYRLSPLPLAQEELIAQKFNAVGRAILFGNGIASVLQGVLAGFAMWLVGLPSAVLWGTIMSLLAFLPLVGISLVVVPATLYLLLAGHVAAALFFFVFCSVEAVVLDNLVKTRLIGSHIKMHDLLIFMSIVGGLAVFGILGVLYGPLLVTLFLTLCELFEADYKHRLVASPNRSTELDIPAMVPTEPPMPTVARDTGPTAPSEPPRAGSAR
jgi:predicted PurR-regulated permease PerM